MAHPQTHVQTGLAHFECVVYGLDSVRESAKEAVEQLHAGGAHALAELIDEWLTALPNSPVITEDEKEAAIQAAREAA